MRIIYQSYLKIGGDRLLWKAGSRRLRILCYHGICEDDLKAQPWVPTEFVTESAFEQQLAYLRKNATILPLGEAVARLDAGTLPPCSVSLTFDDGYSNNLKLAYPLLRKYQAPATIFLTSACIESGEFFPFLKLRLSREAAPSSIPPSDRPVLDYKTNPLDSFLESLKSRWDLIQPQLSADQMRTLRPLTIEDVNSADSGLIDFGAHGHTHCILGNENRERRQHEIRTSIRKVAEWTGRPVRIFSYPNGQRGDFDQDDKSVLRAEGIVAAVSGIRGSNSASTDPFELRRYPVGLFHDQAGYSAEVTGLRKGLLLATGRSIA